jgi:hypothetical protein
VEEDERERPRFSTTIECGEGREQQAKPGGSNAALGVAIRGVVLAASEEDHRIRAKGVDEAISRAAAARGGKTVAAMKRPTRALTTR